MVWVGGKPLGYRFHMSQATSRPVLAPARIDAIDALRGAAMLWMTAFHFSFDLHQFGLISRQNFYLDPFWTLQRLCIVSLFLFCAGLGQAAAGAAPVGWPSRASRFWRRWAQVAGCAVLVSLGSMWMFPHSWISFGVLHGLALMLLLLRLLPSRLRQPLPLLLLAALALLLPQFVAAGWFDSRWTNWIGLVTRKPQTEDYVPLLPWLGVVCIGLVAGQALLARRPAWLMAPLPRALQPLAALGRWSLSYYMLHQPVLIGSLMAWRALHS